MSLALHYLNTLPIDSKIVLMTRSIRLLHETCTPPKNNIVIFWLAGMLMFAAPDSVAIHMV